MNDLRHSHLPRAAVPNKGEGRQGSLGISIVTPNFNGADFLEKTIRSVLHQDFPKLEYVVVDGASRDASMAIVERYRASLSRIISEPDKGHADALNKGFAATTGEIMGWINSDDVLLPGALNFIDRLFRARPDIQWITGRPSSMDEEGRIGWVGPLRPWSRLRFLAGDNKWIQQESTFWRRSLWDAAGGELDLRYGLANDFDLWRRFFRHAELHTVDRHLGCFRIREGQRSIKFKKKYEAEADAILNEELAALDDEFRAAFGALLPARTADMRPLTELAQDRRIAICDPPILTPGEAYGWSAREAGPPAPNGVAMPIWAAAAPSDLSRFKDLHKGERCFIMGNGPSINETNLGLLDGEIVFACNAAFLLFNRISWRPTYYSCVDSRVLPDRAGDIDAMLKSLPSTHGFFPTFLHGHGAAQRRQATRAIVPPGANRHYFYEVANSLDDLPGSMFSTDANECVVQPYTVAITMLQIAAYMGFSEIVLIGCDTNYVVAESVRREGATAVGRMALTSSKDDDANHFDPSYFGRGRQWHDPQPDKMIEHYEHAKVALDRLGVAVYNATVGGRLEVFPRRTLESFFEPARRAPPPRATPVEAGTEETAANEDGMIARIGNLLGAGAALLKRSPTIAIAGAAVLGVLVALAVLYRTNPATPYAFMSVGLVGVLTLLGLVALRLRGFIVELSKQLIDVASGASKPQEGAVVSRIEMEEEIARLRSEVEALKSAAGRRSGDG